MKAIPTHVWIISHQNLLGTADLLCSVENCHDESAFSAKALFIAASAFFKTLASVFELLTMRVDLLNLLNARRLY